MSKVVIRPANADDLAEIEQIARAAYANAMLRISVMPDVTGGLVNHIAEDDVIVAVVDNRMTGFAVTISGKDHLKLANLAVDPNAQGRGVARSLMDEIETIARNKGIKILKLVTHVNMPENVRIYTHLGWNETYREGDRVFMDKQL